MSLNSLDRVGVRLLSPCGSQITSKPDAGPDDSVPDDALELKWEFFFCFFFDQGIGSRSAARASRVDVV